MDVGAFENIGLPSKPTKYGSLCTLKNTGGLQTQRSPFASIDTRYVTRMLGTRTDTLIAGSNVEINNSLTLQRRPGLLAYGTSSIPAPLTFFSNQTLQTPTQLTTSANNLQLIVDTASAIYNYSPTYAGIILNKTTTAQTSFYTLANTMYMSDGIDQYKYTGANLLTYSNTFSNAIWSHLGTTSITAGQTDPNGGSNATAVIFNSTGSSATSYLLQHVSQVTLAGGVKSTPLNYTPVSNNTFTFSVWMKSSNAGDTIFLQMTDSTGAVIVNTQQTLTTGWVKYQVTGTASNNATGISVLINDPSSSSHTYYIYGAQLEVGGPATPTVITTSKQQGVWLWGISAPNVAPTFQFGTPNISLWAPGTNYSIGNQILDSNGNLQTCTAAGKSGSAPPTWNQVVGGISLDGQANNVIQSAFSSSTNGAAVTTSFPNNVTAANAILVIIGVMNTSGVSYADSLVDTPGDSFSGLGSHTSGQLSIMGYYALNVAGGATAVTVNAAGGKSSLLWVGIAEVSGLSSYDTSANNGIPNGSVSTQFNTGSITTAHASEVVISAGGFENSRGLTYELGTMPTGFVPVVSQNSLTSRSNGNKFEQFVVGLQYLSSTQTINPEWSISNGVTDSWVVGLTAGFQSSAGTLQWTNGGQTSGTGLTPTNGGYSYYYSFVNTYTGHRSNVSPLSASTGDFTGQTVVLSGVGCKIPTSGTGASTGTGDPQVDAIEVYRSLDNSGVADWLQIPPSLMQNVTGTTIITGADGKQYLGNPGTSSATGTWTITDSVPDTQLQSQIFAPIGLLNSTPPLGLTNLVFYAGRLWGSVGDDHFYSTSVDNATLLNVLQNGVSAESWEPTNYIPLSAPIVRSVPSGNGLTVFTTQDTWTINGTGLTNFSPSLTFAGVGILSYNALAVDGSNIFIYTSDRQMLMSTPSLGVVEVGFAIGDLIEANINPLTCYLARHIKGSQDNALFFADGSTGWYRLNPYQLGASTSGEQTFVWSPFATITNGLGAVASIETSPGVKTLLCGQTGSGVVLQRDLSTFQDNGNSYTWSATIGSIYLAVPGKLAEVESITTQMRASNSTQCAVAVLLNEITGTFENLAVSTNDPPQLLAPVSVLSNRFFLSPGTVPPILQHMQMQLTGAAATTKDELLAITVRGALIPEQS